MPKSRSQAPYASAASVSDVCHSDDGNLHHLLARAQAYARLNERIAHDLPAPLRERCRIACIRDGVLVITADSAAWATHARLHSERWLSAVRKHWPGSIRQLKFRVQVPIPEPTDTKVPRVLPETVCQHLARCAESQPDPEMAEILQRLAAKRSPDADDAN